MKTWYYAEGKHWRKFLAENDKEALKLKRSQDELIYKESNTPDGRPFIIVWEKKQK